MVWYFIIPLGIALVVNYIVKNATDEIAYIATAILVVSLIVSLIIAPWQLQCLLVILVLLSNIRIWQKGEDAIDESTEPDQNLNPGGSASVPALSYRGINYKVQPKNKGEVNQEVKEGEIIGKYRGQVLKSHTSKNTQVQTEKTQNFEIKYRGIKVNPQKSSLTEVTGNTPLNG